MVLQNFQHPTSGSLFQPAKTCGVSQFKFGNVKTTRLPHKLAELGSISRVHDGHTSIESYTVALVANPPYRHERSGHCGNLENRLQVAVLIREVKLTLAHVGDCTPVAHQEFLSSSTPS